MKLRDSPKEKTHRQVSKPQMERRRRARINGSLGELRALLLRSHTAKSCCRSKMEKADILELTVRYLKALTQAPDPADSAMCVSRSCAGYADCANEGSRFLRASEGVRGAVRAALLHRISDQTAALAHGALTPQFAPFSYHAPSVHGFSFLSDCDPSPLDTHPPPVPAGQILSPPVANSASQPLHLLAFETADSAQMVSDRHRRRHVFSPNSKTRSATTWVWRPW
nr:transcription factor HES-2-like [Paramormyrops kingsleyae]